MRRSSIYQAVFCVFALWFITEGIIVVSNHTYYDHVTAVDFARKLYSTGISQIVVGVAVILFLRHVPYFTSDT
jgi:hypothetical protein